LLRRAEWFIGCYSNDNDRMPEYSDSFDGTPMATRFGGWSVDLPIVEFFHTIADLINAMVEAGFRIERMLEIENSTTLPHKQIA